MSWRLGGTEGGGRGSLLLLLMLLLWLLLPILLILLPGGFVLLLDPVCCDDVNPNLFVGMNGLSMRGERGLPLEELWRLGLPLL